MSAVPFLLLRNRSSGGGGIGGSGSGGGGGGIKGFLGCLMFFLILGGIGSGLGMLIVRHRDGKLDRLVEQVVQSLPKDNNVTKYYHRYVLPIRPGWRTWVVIRVRRFQSQDYYAVIENGEVYAAYDQPAEFSVMQVMDWYYWNPSHKE